MRQNSTNSGQNKCDGLLAGCVMDHIESRPHTPCAVNGTRSLPATLMVAGALLAATAAAAEPPFGLSVRVPYASSRLVGSPDPPPPYTVEKTFTKLTWK